MIVIHTHILEVSITIIIDDGKAPCLLEHQLLHLRNKTLVATLLPQGGINYYTGEDANLFSIPNSTTSAHLIQRLYNLQVHLILKIHWIQIKIMYM